MQVGKLVGPREPEQCLHLAQVVGADVLHGIALAPHMDDRPLDDEPIPSAGVEVQGLRAPLEGTRLIEVRESLQIHGVTVDWRPPPVKVGGAELPTELPTERGCRTP
jgi:hypothetical protein